jgi:hypothetical protein
VSSRPWADNSVCPTQEKQEGGLKPPLQADDDGTAFAAGSSRQEKTNPAARCARSG